MMGEQAGCQAGSQDYCRRAKDGEYRAAGVLPFAVLARNEVLVLLGREGHGPDGGKWQWWRDFGGHREAIDQDAESTAAREFSEETLGMYGGTSLDATSVKASTAAMEKCLRSSSALCVTSPMKDRGHYCMFIAQVQYVDPLMFNLATQENKGRSGVKGAEKNAFAWVSATELLAAAQVNSRRVRVAGSRGRGQLILHPLLVSTLRIACPVRMATCLQTKGCPLLPERTQEGDSQEGMTRKGCRLPSRRAPLPPSVGATPEHMSYWLVHIREEEEPPPSCDWREPGAPACAAESGACSADCVAQEKCAPCTLMGNKEAGDQFGTDQGQELQDQQQQLPRQLQVSGKGPLRDGMVPRAGGMCRVAPSGPRQATADGQVQRCQDTDDVKLQRAKRKFLKQFPETQRSFVANSFHAATRCVPTDPEAILAAVMQMASARCGLGTSSPLAERAPHVDAAELAPGCTTGKVSLPSGVQTPYKCCSSTSDVIGIEPVQLEPSQQKEGTLTRTPLGEHVASIAAVFGRHIGVLQSRSVVNEWHETGALEAPVNAGRGNGWSDLSLLKKCAEVTRCSDSLHVAPIGQPRGVMFEEVKEKEAACSSGHSLAISQQPSEDHVSFSGLLYSKWPQDPPAAERAAAAACTSLRAVLTEVAGRSLALGFATSLVHSWGTLRTGRRRRKKRLRNHG